MTPIVVDQAFVKPYIAGQKVHGTYHIVNDIYWHLSFHIDGYFLSLDGYSDTGDVTKDPTKTQNHYFKRLIDETRPSESPTIKAYRRTVYRPITKTTCHKVINSLKKIVKSPEWKIDWKSAEKPSNIADQETFERYVDKDYPMFGSVENWLYSYAIKFMLTDPNGVIVMLPMNYEKGEADYLKPFSHLIRSCQVLDFVPNEYCVYKTGETTSYTAVEAGVSVTRQGDVLMVLDRNGIYSVEPRSLDGSSVTITPLLIHNYDRLPAWKIGGPISSWHKASPIYESFLSPMLPYLDEGATTFSDYQAEKIQHVYSTMWYYSGQECTTCMGVGKVQSAGDQVICPSCEGSGVFKKSPYKDIVLKQSSFDQKQAPTPPAGYIQKQTEIVDILKKHIEEDLRDALSAINMEFLADRPLSQSGAAKEVDRDELNNFVYGVAYHVVEHILKPVIWWIGAYRYAGLTSIETVNKMQPEIPIPQRFDIITTTMLETSLKSIMDSKVDSEIKDQAQFDYINKAFASSPEVRDRLLAIKRLNPLPNLTVQERGDLALAGLVTENDAILSTYINQFVQQAISENTPEKFFKLSMKDQLAKLMVFVNAKAVELSNQNKPTSEPAPVGGPPVAQ